jgi:hypothetical protein
MIDPHSQTECDFAPVGTTRGQVPFKKSQREIFQDVEECFTKCAQNE